jgi:hypothetical protein
MENMQAKFSVITDTRHPGYVEHNLADVLVIVMCAVLSGLDELGDILLFAQQRKELLKQHFGIEKIPSKPTLSRILSMVDGEAVQPTTRCPARAHHPAQPRRPFPTGSRPACGRATHRCQQMVPPFRAKRPGGPARCQGAWTQGLHPCGRANKNHHRRRATSRPPRAMVMARHAGVSPDTVQRLWSANDIKPHLTRTFKISNDPHFEEKFWDVTGLYLDPPVRALVLCCDEKSQCQALGAHNVGFPLAWGTSAPKPMTTPATGP